MTKKRVKQLLPKLFVTKTRDNGEEFICFSDTVFNERSYSKPLYEAVSGAMFDSNLTHAFSYEVAKRAVDILADLDDWDNSDQLQERVDNAVPIYTGELMEIYAANSWAVDEAVEELGHGESTTSEASQAWYMLIDRMANDIIKRLTALTV